MRRSDQTPFRNTGDCVSYAVHGGTLTPPATPIATCAYVISTPGTYAVTRDLSCGPAPAVTIAASNVAVSLQGHTVTSLSDAFLIGPDVAAPVSNVAVSGPGTAVGYHDAGVVVRAADHSTVSGVNASGGATGILLGSPAAHDDTLVGNTTNSNSGDGIHVTQAIRIEIASNTCSSNGDAGINLGDVYAGFGYIHTDDMNIHDNTCNTNANIGISAGLGAYDNVITHNTALHNARYDLGDNHANCGDNIWADNTYVTKTPDCIR
ncbi:hypothetical protein GCM10027596_25500 [Nocardioides korecus]